VQVGITPGHEICGSIVAGDDEGLKLHKVQMGDRVTVEQIVPCQKCRYCDRGQYRASAAEASAI
jgi:threonine dehydrogenase-like Zn-dependent dehydrogenase